MTGIAHALAAGWRRTGGWGTRRRLRRLVIAVLAVAGVAMAATGAAGVVRYGETFWLYRGFPAPVLPLGVAKPEVTTITVASPALDGYKDTVYVVLPPGYASQPRRRYPVLYLLHGYTGYPWNFLTTGDLAPTYASLLAAGEVQPMILVMPSGTRSFMTDTEWVNWVGTGNLWETFVARDLVNAIDARYRTVRSGSARGIAGYSEGGYAALNIGLHHPGEFALLEGWSGYVIADNNPAFFDHSRALLRYNSPIDDVFTVAARLRAARTYIWFYCGRTDVGYTAQNNRFAAELTALGIAHDFLWEPGSHSWALWRDMIPQSLITASEHLSHG